MTVSLLYIGNLKPLSLNYSLTASSVVFVTVCIALVVLSVAIIAMSSANLTSVLVDGL